MVMFLPARFPAWVALSVFSLISLLAVVEDKKRGQWQFEEKWSTALISISFGLAVLSCLAHGFQNARDKYVASKSEGIVILVIVIVWSMALPVIMAPKHSLAVQGGGMGIVDANLYFASWLSFAVAMYIFVNHGSSTYGLSSVDQLSYYAKFWLCLFVTSIIAMTASIRLFDNTTNCTSSNQRCRNLRLGIALSAISAGFAVLVVVLSYMKKLERQSIGLVLSILVLAIWCTLVALLTFKNGPGSYVGNLFFSTWISFILSLYLFMMHLEMNLYSSEYSTTSSDTDRRNKQEQPLPK